MKNKLGTFMIFTFLVIPQISFASKGDTRHAQKEFKAAARLFEQGEYVAAADKFRQSYQYKPSYKILYNVGQSEAAARRYGIALQAFEQYLADGGDDVPQARQEEVRNEISRLRDLTGILEITAPNDAEIFIDNVLRGVYPANQRIPVAATVVHEVAIRTVDGTGDQVTRASVSGGDSVSVDLTSHEAESEETVVATLPTELEEEPATSTNEALSDFNGQTQTIAVRKNKSRFIAGIALGSAGVGSIIVGSIFGGLALNKNTEVEKKCPQGICDEQFRDLVNDRDRFAVLNSVFLFAGGALVAAGGVLVTLSLLKKDKLNGPAVAVSPTPFGIAVSGNF
ncbi:MAG: hypothetical protein JXR76_17840 [Deltaproteobacteria bacterium]|nr:hypothetical protein [Deltaproteobacteria bacterium]